MLFLKTFKDAKFLVDGNAFQTFITLSTKKRYEAEEQESAAVSEGVCLQQRHLFRIQLQRTAACL